MTRLPCGQEDLTCSASGGPQGSGSLTSPDPSQPTAHTVPSCQPVLIQAALKKCSDQNHKCAPFERMTVCFRMRKTKVKSADYCKPRLPRFSKNMKISRCEEERQHSLLLKPSSRQAQVHNPHERTPKEPVSQREGKPLLTHVSSWVLPTAQHQPRVPESSLPSEPQVKGHWKQIRTREKQRTKQKRDCGNGGPTPQGHSPIPENKQGQLLPLTQKG